MSKYVVENSTQQTPLLRVRSVFDEVVQTVQGMGTDIGKIRSYAIHVREWNFPIFILAATKNVEATISSATHEYCTPNHSSMFNLSFEHLFHSNLSDLK